MNEQHFQKIVQLFERSDCLPKLPEPAIRLMEMIDKSDPGPVQMEQAIGADPSLAACLLRTASSVAYGATQPVTSIRGAVMRLGLRAVRTIALTFAMQAMLGRKSQSENFDPQRFARHSLYVAVAARHVYLRVGPVERRVSGWAPEEMFAAALLHDLATSLLAQSAPDLFDRAWNLGAQENSTIDAAFMKLYGIPLPMLGCAAIVAWRLPELFAQGMAFMVEPPATAELQICRDSIVFADSIARTAGFGLEDWPVQSVEVPGTVWLADEDLPLIEKECEDLESLIQAAAA